MELTNECANEKLDVMTHELHMEMDQKHRVWYHNGITNTKQTQENKTRNKKLHNLHFISRFRNNKLDHQCIFINSSSTSCDLMHLLNLAPRLLMLTYGIIFTLTIQSNEHLYSFANFLNNTNHMNTIWRSKGLIQWLVMRLG